MQPNRFKFRAWDEKNNCFLLNENKCGEYLSNYFVTFNGFIWEKEKIGDESLDMREIVLMQSTGLLDRSGKEIFEGDILKTQYVGSDGVRVVKYSLGDNFSGFGFLENLNTSEVIGNKFENPELLK